MKNLVVNCYSGSIIQICQIEFPWGDERIGTRFPEIGWRTADPLSGEWELLDWERSSSGYGKLTFYYHPAPGPICEASGYKAFKQAYSWGVEATAAELKAWDRATAQPEVYTTVPAIFVSRGNRSLGYGSTGQAVRRDWRWSFFPDGEPDRGIACLEEELFFPLDPGITCGDPQLNTL